MKETRNECKISIGKFLGKPRRKWMNNIKMEHRETLCEDERWTEMTQDHVQCWVLVLMAFCYHSIRFAAINEQ
jgi:hypothetical protein